MTRAHHTLFAILTIAAAGAACAADDSSTDTTVHGQARYADAETDEQGQTREAARPDTREMRIEVVAEGTADLGELDAQCTLDGASGQFRALFQGNAEVGDDGAYVATLASADAVFETAGGCAAPALSITAVGEVLVRASLEADRARCDGYCAAQARSQAEAECGATPSSAACRGEAEADYQATCELSCTDSETVAIVAEARLSADAVARMNADGLTGRGLGELELDLTFDRLHDANGDTVDN